MSGQDNRELMKAMQELRRSNATSRHTLKKHKGTRSAAKRAAINEQTGAHRGRLSRYESNDRYVSSSNVPTSVAATDAPATACASRTHSASSSLSGTLGESVR